MPREPNQIDARGMWDVTRPNQQRNAIYGERWPTPYVPIPAGPHVLFTRDDRGGLGAAYSGLNNLNGATTNGGWPPMNVGWGYGSGQYADALGFAAGWWAQTPNFKINWLWFPCFYNSYNAGQGPYAYEIRICTGFTGDTSARVYETAGTFSPKLDTAGGFERVDLPVTGTTYGTMHLDTGTWYQIMWHTNWNGANSSYASCNRGSHTVTHNGLAQSLNWANPQNVNLWNGYQDLGTTTSYGNLFGFAVTYY